MDWTDHPLQCDTVLVRLRGDRNIDHSSMIYQMAETQLYKATHSRTKTAILNWRIVE